MPESAVTVSSLRLLRTPAPYSGESFPGYLLRLTEENSYDSLRWIPERAGLKVDPAAGRWADLWRPCPRLSRLREITGLSEAELESLRETLAPGCLVRWKAPKVCSACLREESWCRKVWDVLPFTACPLHRLMLIDSCPHCYQVLSWARKSVSVCRCGYDWRRISSPVIEDDRELTAARRMLSIWRENAPGDFPLEDATGRALTREGSAMYPDALCALVDAWLFLRNKVRLQPTAENQLCHRAVTAVASALDDWPESFFRFCDEFDTAALQNLQQLWFRYSGSELSETQGWLLLVAALEEYLEGRQNGVRPALKRLLWMEEAGRQLGLDVSQVERLVEQGKLRTIASVREESISWIDSHSLRRLVREIERMQTAREVAADLGIGLSQLSDLAQYGRLSPDSGPRVDGCDETKFSRKTLAAFIDRISELVTPHYDGGEYSVVPLGRVADHLWLHGLSFGQFVQAMFAGFPRPAIEQGGLPGRLSRFWFRIDEINQYLDSQLDPDKRPAAVHYAIPSLSKMANWLDRKQEEVDNRFYRSHQKPPHVRNQRDGFVNTYAADQLRRIMASVRLQQERSYPTKQSV
jgi:hypothetical protein